MTNYIRPGFDRKFTAGANTNPGDVVVFNSGNGGSIGVSKDYVANGAQGVAAIAGEFRLAKATGTAMAAGLKVYWDNGAKNLTTTSTSNTPAGEIHCDALSGDTTAVILLNSRCGEIRN